MTETEHGGSIESTGTVVAEYARLRPTYESYTAKLAGLIENLLETADIGVHKIEPRCKEVDKFKEKINRAGKAYEDPLREVTDLVGVRVIAYYPEDVDKICDLLRQEFEVDEANSTDKRAALDPDRFGYLSYHLVVTLGPSRKRLAEWRACAEIKAEIQVRTVLQHAWAEIEHDLGYKTEADVPAAMRRKFSRLAGLLELVDEEFVSIRRDRERYARKVARSIGAAQAVELDVVSLRSYLERDRARAIDARIAEQLALDLDEEPFYPDYLVRLLQFAGLRTVREVERALDRHAMQVLGAVRPYFDFTRDSFGFDHRSLRQLPRGYGLLLLAHVVVLDGHELELQRREALTRLYTHMDYPDDEAAARRVAHHLIDILEPRRESGDPA